MSTKTVSVNYQIEGSVSIDVPVDATEAEIERLAGKAVNREAGPLSVDIVSWDVVDSD